LITFLPGYSQVMTDPRDRADEPSKERLHDEAEREEALKREERAHPREEKDPPNPFSGSDH
jgi:hypothetical protein